MNNLGKKSLLCLVLIFAVTVCYAGTEKDKLILDGIAADIGDGSNVKVKLRVGKEAKGEIYGIDESLSAIEGKFTSKAPKDKEVIIVSDGFAVIVMNINPIGEIPAKVKGEFFVDDSLNLTGEGKWDGKKVGAIHTIIGKVTMFGYEFDSNSNDPLVFKMTQAGYAYQSGAGTIKVLKDGKIYEIKKYGDAIPVFLRSKE